MFKIGYLVDFHMHTKFSFDSKAQMEEMCERSIGKGLAEICFTEHFSVNSYDPSFEYFDYEKYSEKIDSCREQFKNKLIIKKGIEIGEPHVNKGLIEKFMNGKNFDFVIGSVHNIGKLKIRAYIADKNKKKSYGDYFKEVYESVLAGDMDALGHLDLVKRYAHDKFGNYDFDDYRDIIAAILETIIKRDICLELNTSGLVSSSKENFPSQKVVELYKDVGGNMITIGSDAHRSEMVGHGIKKSVELLMAVGFDEIVTFENRKPNKIPIENHR